MVQVHPENLSKRDLVKAYESLKELKTSYLDSVQASFPDEGEVQVFKNGTIFKILPEALVSEALGANFKCGYLDPGSLGSITLGFKAS